MANEMIITDFKNMQEAVSAAAKRPTLEELVKSADPDSILGGMERLKQSLDAFHSIMQKEQNEVVARKLTDDE